MSGPVGRLTLKELLSLFVIVFSIFSPWISNIYIKDMFDLERFAAPLTIYASIILIVVLALPKSIEYGEGVTDVKSLEREKFIIRTAVVYFYSALLVVGLEIIFTIVMN